MSQIINGIMGQKNLPRAIDESAIKEASSPDKALDEGGIPVNNLNINANPANEFGTGR